MRLTDCFSETVAYVSYFLKEEERQQQVPFDQFRSRVNSLLNESENRIQKGNFTKEDYDLARFALCAWIDEAILSSPWECRLQWQKEQLQRQYYNTTDAGQEFYDRLNTLGLQQVDVREVYYLCLAMGFKGRYCHEGEEMLLDQLKVSNLKLLTGSSVGVPSLESMDLFTEAYPAEVETFEPGMDKSGFSLWTAAFLVSPVLLFGALFMIYHFILANLGASFLKTGL